MKTPLFAVLFASLAVAAFSACSSSDGAKAPNIISCDADAGDGACAASGPCAAEVDCASGTHCDLGTGVCGQCTSNAHCSATQDCLADQCVERCTADAACADGAHCSNGHCRECATNDQCSTDQHCVAGSCAKNLCQPGSSDCAPDHAGVRACSADGSEQLLSPCPASQTCVAAGASAACQPWLCSPSLKSCTPSQSAVRTCSDDGLSYAETSTCGKGEHCASGQCVTTQCAANQLLCKDGASYLCAADGLSSTLQATCASGELCDEETGACRTQSCTPGAVQCLNTSIGTCRADGSGFDVTPCALDETCASGVCKPLICPPGGAFCVSATDFSVCNATGTAIISRSSCTQNTRCTDAGGTTISCASSTCTPGEVMCNGALATVCKSDGSGPADGGTDCSSASGYCESGACQPNACTPNQRFCSGDYVYLCQPSGQTSTFYQSCASTGTHCNPASAACESYKCTANSVTCANSLVVRCDATGFNTTTVKDCASTGQVCSAGACATQVCTANTTYCKSGNVYTCNSDGTGEYVSKLCGGSSYCSAGNCIAMTCQPGQPTCNGNAVATCAADGSGPTGTGSACSAGQSCVSGVCQTLTCTANASFCAAGDVQKCNALGTGSTLAQHCFSESFCAGGQCKPDVCTALKPYCSTTEALTTCSADGSGPATPGTSCPAGQVCTLTGCSVAAVDTLGGQSSNFTTGYVAGQIVRVTTSRKLTQIELNVVAPENPVTWVVYSSTDGVSFTQVATSLSGSLPAGFASSGPLAVELLAGSYYFIGAMPSYILSPYTEQNVPTQLSFGIALNEGYYLSGLPTTFTPTQNSNTHLNMRFTTTTP